MKRQETRIVRSIKQRLSDNNLVLCKADKGNTVTIIKKEDHINKVNDFKATNKFTKLDKDPTNNFNKIVLQKIKACTKTIKNATRNKVMKPRPPILYGLPKLRKP